MRNGTWRSNDVAPSVHGACRHLGIAGGLCLLAGIALAQAVMGQVIHGRVVDVATGSPLSAASIQVDGTYRGTITNVDGFYELKVDALPVTLVVRFLGYETIYRVVEDDAALEQHFALVPVTYVYAEITVSGEDPANAIMREVIARKKQWRASLETYETQGYSRFSIESDTSVVWVMESASTAYWDRERGMKERITGNRSTANSILDDTVMPVAMTVANLYDDNVLIAGHNLMGVTHPDALSSYDFTLEGTRMLDGVTVYSIAVAPKNRLFSGFHGRVSVLDSAFAMVDVELQPGESFLFPQPIQRYEVAYRQQFSSFGGDYWMPVDFRSEVLAKISMPGLLSFPAFKIDHVARFTDYQVNVPVPEELYAEEQRIEVDSAAVEEGQVFEEPGLVVPLTEAETAAYNNPDIEDDFEEAFTPGGLLGRAMRFSGGGLSDSEGEENRTDTTRNARVLNLLRPMLQEVRYNRVEGLHLGIGSDWDFARHFSVGGNAGWSSGLRGSDRWNWHASLGAASPGDVSVFAEGRYEHTAASRYEKGGYHYWYNSVGMVLGGADYFDYYRREGIALTAGVARSEPHVRLAGTFRDEMHQSLPMTTSYDVLGRPPLPVNPAIVPGQMQSVEIALAIGRRQFFSGPTGNRTLTLGAELSTPRSDYAFQRYWIDASWRQITFGSRRFLPALLHLRFKAGIGSDNLPLQRVFIVDSRLGEYAQFGTLRAVQDRPFQGNDMVAFFWKHDFRTMIFEALRLGTVARRGYGIQLFGGHARTWFPGRQLYGDRQSPVRLGTNGSYHELGISLSGIWGLLRIDLVKRLGDGPFRVMFGTYSPF